MTDTHSSREPGGNRAPLSLQRETVWLLAVLAMFLLINLATAERTPAVWCDEVMYADPAVNLFQGRGFTSGAWFLQGPGQFWAGNVPLYQFVLFAWLKVFGFSVTGVRSLHFALVSAAGLVSVLAIRRLNLIARPGHRLLFLGLMLLSTASAFVFRFARPESLAMLLLAGALFIVTIRPRGLRLSLLLLDGILLTWNGLQFAACVSVISALLWFFGSKRFRLETLFLWAGCAFGVLLLFLFYEHFGVWHEFVGSVRHFTVANQGTNYPDTYAYGSGLSEKIRQVPGLYRDLSSLPLLAFSLWMLFGLLRARALPVRSPLVFGVAAALGVPLALHAIGVFPIYYFWMAFFPLALGCCAQLDSWLKIAKPRNLSRLLMVLLLGTACALGLVRRLAGAALAWRARSYSPVMALASPYVDRDKWVFCEFAAYYAAKQHGAEAILPNCAYAMGADDKSRISVAIIHTGDAMTLSRLLGGRWQDTGSSLKIPPESAPIGLRETLDSGEYNLRVFLREPGTP